MNKVVSGASGHLRQLRTVNRQAARQTRSGRRPGILSATFIIPAILHKPGCIASSSPLKHASAAHKGFKSTFSIQPSLSAAPFVPQQPPKPYLLHYPQGRAPEIWHTHEEPTGLYDTRVDQLGQRGPLHKAGQGAQSSTDSGSVRTGLGCAALSCCCGASLQAVL